MLRIGITGGIATGKSTVSRYLLSRGYPVLDADQLARQLVQPGQAGLRALVNRLGSAILNEQGELDRGKLGQTIFADQAIRRVVNDCLHPLIFQALEEEASRLEAQGYPFIFLDIPLLYETSYQKQVDQVWVIYVSQACQRDRLMARNQWSQAQAEQAMVSQGDLEVKRQQADLVIDNQGSQAATFTQLDAAIRDLENQTTLSL